MPLANVKNPRLGTFHATEAILESRTMSNPLRPIMIQCRAALGLRQEDAAAKVPCSPSTWVRWESACRLPSPGAWVKIARVLGLKLDHLQRVAGTALIEIGGGMAKQPATKDRPEKEVDPVLYEYLCMDALAIDKALNNVDLHKLRQTGWHYTLSEQRAALIEQLRAIDMQIRSARHQAEIFLQFYTHLLGNETGRVLPRVKQKQKFTAPTKKRGVPKPKGQKPKKKQ